MIRYEATTTLGPTEVIARARDYFARVNSPYSAFPDQVGEHHIRLQLDMGEIVIGVTPGDGYSRVRGSASRGAGLLTRFLAELPAPEDPRSQPSVDGQERAA